MALPDNFFHRLTYDLIELNTDALTKTEALMEKEFPTDTPTLYPVREIIRKVLSHADSLKEIEVSILLERLGFTPAAGFGREQTWRLKTFLNDYNFFRRSTANAISNFEGSACSTDKALSLLEFYLKTEVEVRRGKHEQPMFNSPVTEDNEWRFVEERTLYCWFSYIDSMFHILAGNPRKMIAAYQALEEIYSEEKV